MGRKSSRGGWKEESSQQQKDGFGGTEQSEREKHKTQRSLPKREIREIEQKTLLIRFQAVLGPHEAIQTN